MNTINSSIDAFIQPPARRGEPVWPLARLHPHQGDWTEDEYFALNASFLVELSDGFLEFPPMPTLSHQLIAFYFAKLLDLYVSARKLGLVVLAPLPVHLWKDKAREPDVLFIRPDRPRYHGEYPQGVDLAVEIVSGGSDDRKRDLVTKREEYAAAGIPEYWIIDPHEELIIVLTLDGKIYREHRVFRRGESANSVLLPDFAVDVNCVLDAGKVSEQ
jgi:Uma2 family endonuclease